MLVLETPPETLFCRSPCQLGPHSLQNLIDAPRHSTEVISSLQLCDLGTQRSARVGRRRGSGEDFIQCSGWTFDGGIIHDPPLSNIQAATPTAMTPIVNVITWERSNSTMYPPAPANAKRVVPFFQPDRLLKAPTFHVSRQARLFIGCPHRGAQLRRTATPARNHDCVRAITVVLPAIYIYGVSLGARRQSGRCRASGGSGRRQSA